MISSVVFFDLDGTLVVKPSSERRFFNFLWKNGKLSYRQLFSATLFFLRYSLQFGLDVGRKNKAYLCGLNVQEIEFLGKNWVDNSFDDLFYPQMASEIMRHKKNGSRLVLLTGAPDFLAKPIAKRLALHDYIATQCAHNNGHFISAPPQQHPFGASKLELATEYCHAAGVKLEQCVAYGDSYHDFKILKAVGQGFAVNPGRRMLFQAQDNNWEIIITD